MNMFLLGVLVMYLISFVLVMLTDSCWEYTDIILCIVYFPFYIITVIKRIITIPISIHIICLYSKILAKL